MNRTTAISWTAGLGYYRMGHHRKALEVILEASCGCHGTRYDPGASWGYLSHLGKKAKANRAYQRALEFEHPEPEKIQEKLRQVE